MKILSFRSFLLALCVALGAARASAYPFTITLDTSALVNHAAGPFALDLQSIYGSGDAQQVKVSGVKTTGGGFVAGTDWATGAVSGDLASTLLFAPSSWAFYNEFLQVFDPTVSSISFRVDLTKNPTAGTPTSFAVSLLDAANLYAIPTTGFADTLVFFNLDGAASTYATASSTGDTAGVTVRVHVPEAGATLALLAAALGLLLLARRHRRAHA